MCYVCGQRLELDPQLSVGGVGPGILEKKVEVTVAWKREWERAHDLCVKHTVRVGQAN
jgi:hypothetical protein